jgi:formylglycine-generating enzyme required for sulfatase activity
VAVPSFYLMVNEVTNEQYAAFLRAALVRPPFPWGRKAIAAGREGWLAEQERRRAGGGVATSAEEFDAQRWWSENWRGRAFEIPEGDELRPVVFVDFQDAQTYARWAGLRLMTELEFERAVRGDSERAYPWGDEWDDQRFAATSHLKRRMGAFLVGSFPAGASKQGVHDLVGNVWEWTASPYTPFPGYELKVYEFGYGPKVRQVNAVADFNAERRVAVGGSFQNTKLMARATTRRGTDPEQTSDALGFRCATSVAPGLDIATRLLETELTPNALPREDGVAIELDPTAVVAAQRWDSMPSAFALAPPGYAVITAHTSVAFVPVRQIAATDLASFERLSLERLGEDGRPVTLGVLATSVRLLEPDLAPGTYVVSYRARGTRRVDGPDKAAAFERALSLDAGLDWIVLGTLDGKPVHAFPQRVEWATQRSGRALFVDPESTPRTDGPPLDERTLRLEICLATRTSRRGLAFVLPLRAEPGAFDGAWRCTR